MLISEKKKSMSWQIKTKDGQYYQPDSLASLYAWIFEARLSPDDFVFIARQNDWAQLTKMPELSYCFWKLLGSDGNIYGPISIGELKQLYINNQIVDDSKISIYDSDNWKEIKDIGVLNRWFRDTESTAVDYVQLVEKLHDYYSKQNELKEKISKNTENSSEIVADQKKYVKQLESDKLKLEKVLSDTLKKLEEYSAKVNQHKAEYDSVQEELKLLKIDIQEKTNAIEQLNKQNAQAEVTHTLKDDEINQLRSSLKLLQTEIQSVRDLKSQDGQSVLSGVNEAISELTSENKKLSGSLSEYKKLIAEKDETIKSMEVTLNKALAENDEINKKVLSFEKNIAEKENLINSLNNSSSDSIKQIGDELIKKDAELQDLHKAIEDKTLEIRLHIENSKKLQDDLEKASIQIREDSVIVKDLKDILNSREADINVLNEKIAAKEQELISSAGLISKLEADVSKINHIVSDLSNSVSAKDEKIGSLEDIIKSRENEIESLKAIVAGEVSNKNEVILEIENIKKESEQLKSVISDNEAEIEKLSKLLNEKSEFINKLEKNNELLIQKKDDIKADYERKIQEVMLSNERQMSDLNIELNNVNEVLSQRDQDILAQKTEICRLNDLAIAQDLQWQEKLKAVKEETAKLAEQFESEKNMMRSEFDRKISDLDSEKTVISEKFNEAENEKNRLLGQLQNLQNEILDRNKIIESVKEDARSKENVFQIKLDDLQQQVAQLKENSEVLYQKGKELEVQIQDGLNREQDLKKEVLFLNEELQKEKSLSERLRKEYEEIKQLNSGFEAKLADAKKDLEKAEEENKNSQRQFYLDKQKMSKEYNDTISKLDKLQKRTVLEREIQDRSKMKSELERLYALLKENFEGIQRGASEIESSCRNLSEDIDNKNLSLKYLIETEKREGKRGPFSKADSGDEQDASD